MRGDQELKCLNFARNKLFSGNINQNYFYFGLSKDDCSRFEEAFRSAGPNENSSEFPDFKFKGGFIEHFQVTSSATDRKGAKHKKEENAFHETIEKQIAEIETDLNNAPCFGVVKSKSRCHSYPAHSYGDFKKSFKNTWNKHIESLKKYSGEKNNGIFLIEYNERILMMSENTLSDVKEGILYGDLMCQPKPFYYRLSRDKIMLDFMYEFKDLMKFVVYVCHDGVEIIKLENIPELKKLLPRGLAIAPAQCPVECATSYYTSTSSGTLEKDDNNDE